MIIYNAALLLQHFCYPFSIHVPTIFGRTDKHKMFV